MRKWIWKAFYQTQGGSTSHVTQYCGVAVGHPIDYVLVTVPYTRGGPALPTSNGAGRRSPRWRRS